MSRSLAVLCLLLLASSALAAEAEHPEAKPAPYGYSADHFASIWNRRRVAINKGDFMQADRLLDELVTSKLRAGWPDAFAYAESVAWESRALGVAGDWKRALDLGMASLELGPHRLNPHLAVASARWALGDWQGSFSELNAGLHLIWSEPPYLRARLGNFLLAFLGALLVTGLAFAFAALYRHLTPLWHDVGHLLPDGSVWWQYVLLVVTLVFWPLLFRVGVVGCIAWWLLLTAPYQQVKERWAAATVLLGLLLATLALPALTGYLAYPRSQSEALYRAARDLEATDAAAQLQHDASPSAETMAVLGLRARWSGDAKAARALIEKAQQAGFDAAELQLAFGNTAFLLGDYGAAERTYQDLVSASPRHTMALFNLSQARAATGDAAGAADARRRVGDLDAVKTAAWTTESTRTGIGVIEPHVPARILGTGYEPGVNHAQAVDQLWRGLGGPLPRIAVAAFLALALMWTVVLAALKLSGGHLGTWAGACVRCGDAACRRCIATLQDVERCAVCAQAARDESSSSPQDNAGQQLRIRKEIDSHRYHARLLQTQRVFNYILAGNGQLLRGSAWRGFLLMLAFCTCAMAVAMGIGIIPEPLPAYHGFSGLFTVIYVFVAIVLYTVAVLDGRHEES